MSGTCETVVIETSGGPVTINKSDFDPKIHKIPGEKKPAPKKKRATRAK